MKNLFVSIICFHLIIGQSAHALEDKYTTTGTGSQGGYDFYSKQILGLGTSIIGASILKQCTSGLRIPSIATFMAGSVVNIWAEINASKSEYQYKMTKLSQIKIKEEQLAKKGGEFQKQLLLENLDSEKKSVEFLKKRKAWMIAVDVIYLAATGLAIAEQTYGTVAAMGGGIGKCAQIAAQQASSCATGYAACYAAHFAACSGVQPTGYLTAQSSFALEKAKEIAEKTCSGTAIYKDACDTSLKIYLNLAFGACKSKPTDGGLLSFSFPKLLSMGWGFMASKTGGDGAINKYGKMMYTMLGLLVPKLHTITPKAFNFPIPRSITFGTFSALAIAITKGLDTRQKKAEQNVALLEKAINKFELETNSNGGLAEGLPVNDFAPVAEAAGPVRAPASYNVTALATVEGPRECLSIGQELTQSVQSCNNPIKFTAPDFSHVPTSTLTNVSNQSIQLANAVALGDTTKADLIAAEISAQATRVQMEVKQLQQNYNNSQKEKKETPLDFDKAIAANVQSLDKNVNDASASSGTNLADFSQSTNEETQNNASEGASGEVVATNDVPNIPIIPIPAMPDFSAGLGDSASDSNEIERSLAGKTDDKGKDFISQVPFSKEVASDSYENLFKRVSDRYILNYSKIFDKKKKVNESSGLEF